MGMGLETFQFQEFFHFSVTGLLLDRSENPVSDVH